MRILMKRLCCFFAFLLLAGCAGREPEDTGFEEFPPPPVIEEARPTTAGTLWTDGQGYMFQDVKARDVGDIVTVAIYERSSASKEASTSTGRSSSMSAGLSRLFGLEDNLATIGTGFSPSAMVDAEYDNQFKGSGTTVRKEDLVATLTTRVVEVFPNDTLRIEGGKMVTVNSEKQFIRLSGIIRSADISPRNIVDSKNILDARISYTGKGVLSDKQRQGWLVRILDNVWPF